jgi:hypothetical protein
MAINYGSHNVSTSGLINTSAVVVTDAPRTLYFTNNNNNDWANLNNWYYDVAGTLPADSLPTSNDIAILNNASLATVSSGDITANTIIFNSGSSIISGELVIYAHVIMNDDVSMNSTASLINIGSTNRTYNLTLNNTSGINGTEANPVNGWSIYGNITLNDSSIIAGITNFYVYGNLIINGTSSFGNHYDGNPGNNNEIGGDVIINGNNNSTPSSLRTAIVNGNLSGIYANIADCQIESASVNLSYSYIGGGQVYSDSFVADNSTTITGTEFNSTNIILNDGSIIHGSVNIYNGKLTLNDSSYIVGVGGGGAHLYFHGNAIVEFNNPYAQYGSIVHLDGYDGPDDNTTTVIFNFSAPDIPGGETGVPLKTGSTVTCNYVIFRNTSYMIDYINWDIKKQVEFYDQTVMVSYNGNFVYAPLIIFNDISYIYDDSGAQVPGGPNAFNKVIFNNNATNYAYLSCNTVIFNDSSINDGQVGGYGQGRAIFNDYSSNIDYIHGKSIFNHYSYNTGDIDNDAIFNDFSSNETGGYVDGAAYYYSPYGSNGGTDSSGYFPCYNC